MGSFAEVWKSVNASQGRSATTLRTAFSIQSLGSNRSLNGSDTSGRSSTRSSGRSNFRAQQHLNHGSIGSIDAFLASLQQLLSKVKSRQGGPAEGPEWSSSR